MPRSNTSSSAPGREAGLRVPDIALRPATRSVLFEAGGDNYPFSASVPPFATLVTEDPSIQWDYWVRRTRTRTSSAGTPNTCQARTSPIRAASRTPGRCGRWMHDSLGALLDVPSDSDWDNIAQLTGDSSWNSDRMRTYFQRVENCTYVPRSADNPSRHGFFGWLPSAVANSSMFANDTGPGALHPGRPQGDLPERRPGDREVSGLLPWPARSQ